MFATRTKKKHTIASIPLVNVDRLLWLDFDFAIAVVECFGFVVSVVMLGVRLLATATIFHAGEIAPTRARFRGTRELGGPYRRPRLSLSRKMCRTGPILPRMGGVAVT